MIKTFTFNYDSNYLGKTNGLEYCPKITIFVECEYSAKGITQVIERVETYLFLDGEPIRKNELSEDEVLEIQTEAEKIVQQYVGNWAQDLEDSKGDE